MARFHSFVLPSPDTQNLDTRYPKYTLNIMVQVRYSMCRPPARSIIHSSNLWINFSVQADKPCYISHFFVEPICGKARDSCYNFCSVYMRAYLRACVRSSKFVRIITFTFMPGFQNNLAQLFWWVAVPFEIFVRVSWRSHLMVKW